MKKNADTYLRVLVVEIAGLASDREEHGRLREQLLDLMRQVQEVQNYFFDEFRAWHFANGTQAKLLEFHLAWEKWRESKKELKNKPTTEFRELIRPVLKIRPIPSVLSKKIYAGAVSRWPNLHTRLITLTINRLTQSIASKKSARGNWPGWHSMLLWREQIPCFTSPCPLAFDKANSFLEPPKVASGESYKLHVTFQREAIPGKRLKRSVTYHATIWDKGRKMAGRKVTLAKIASGEYAFCGSQVFSKNCKLFAALAFRQPKPSPLGINGTAILRASATHPLTLRMNGRSRWIGGDGRIIATIRRQLMAQRWSRQQSYRCCASSARKGHGFRRAMEKVTLLSNRWRDFVRTANRNFCAQLIRLAIEAGCGTIMYIRPCKADRYLSLAGKSDQRDASGWDWYGLEKTLSDQSQAAGLTIVFDESGSEKHARLRELAESTLK